MHLTVGFEQTAISRQTTKHFLARPFIPLAHTTILVVHADGLAQLTIIGIVNQRISTLFVNHMIHLDQRSKAQILRIMRTTQGNFCGLIEAAKFLFQTGNHTLRSIGNFIHFFGISQHLGRFSLQHLHHATNGFRSVFGIFGQFAHFIRHHREPPARLTRTRRLNRGI